MSYVPALDVSQQQGDINWSLVDRPITLIKMSGGDAGLYTDNRATANYYGAKAASKAIGMYHFAGGGDPGNEADFFISACSPLEEDDVMILDWELPHNDPVGWCKTFRDRVHDRTGVWVLLYINLATLNQYDWTPVLDNSGLWLAAWNNDPEALLTNKTYVMHQYSSTGAVPGVTGRTDLDAWFGTVEQFKKYGYHAPTSSTPPVNTPVPPVVVAQPGTNIDGVIPADPSAPPTAPTQTVEVPPVVSTPIAGGSGMSKYAKFIVALGAALGVLAAALADGALSATELVQVVLAFLGAIGVYSVKNKEN